MSEESGIKKWIIGIILLLGLGTGSYFIYHYVKKNQAIKINNQIQIDKEILIKEIAESENTLRQNQAFFDDQKNQVKDSKKQWIQVYNSAPARLPKNYTDPEVEKLEKQREELWQKNWNLHLEFNDWVEETRKKINTENETAKKWWSIQKNNGWQALTSALEKDPVVHEKFDKLLKTFYWRFRQMEGMPEGTFVPEIPFLGFEKFDIGKTENEMGHCNCSIEHLEGDEDNHLGIGRITIVINPKYLLNKKLQMDKFYDKEPTDENGYQALPIGFDNKGAKKEEDLIGTIAHELAHAIQHCIEWKTNRFVNSQCKSSGDGERAWVTNKKGEKVWKLVKPKYPDLIKEHTKLWKKFKVIILNSPEFQEFKKWWTSSAT